MKHIMFSARVAHQPGNEGEMVGRLNSTDDGSAFRAEAINLSNMELPSPQNSRRQQGMVVRLSSMNRLPNSESLLFEVFTRCPRASYLTSACFNSPILKIRLLVILTIHAVTLPRGQQYHCFWCIPLKICYVLHSPQVYSFSLFFTKMEKHVSVPFSKKKLTTLSQSAFQALHKEPPQLY